MSALFQIGEEIKGCLDFLRFVYGRFGFSFKLYLSTRPDKYMGKLELWDSAEAVRQLRGLLYIVTHNVHYVSA